jgi:hypothetical protein
MKGHPDFRPYLIVMGEAKASGPTTPITWPSTSTYVATGPAWTTRTGPSGERRRRSAIRGGHATGTGTVVEGLTPPR